jgi:hypothetical protein
MNSTGKFLVSALLVHAANLKKLSDTQASIRTPSTVVPSNNTAKPPIAGSK